MTHCYLTLPSNSSQQFFPGNTLTEFTTKLPSTIELTNQCEVGLAEIMFPRSWYTIQKEGVIIFVDFRDCDGSTTVAKFKLRGGFYKTMEEVTQELNLAASTAFAVDCLDKKIVPPVFYYKVITNEEDLRHAIGRDGHRIIPPYLESILCLALSQNLMCNNTNDKASFRGDLSCDL